MQQRRLSTINQLLFNSEVAQKSRLAWVDYAKGLAIILVAYRHVLYGFERSGLIVHPYLMNANEIFYSFRMPLFFILSGAFISGSLAKRTTMEMIINKCKTLLWPYVIWCIIQITLQIIFSKYTNANRSLRSYTFILLQPDALDQLWYLFALFNVSVLYIILKAVCKIPPVVLFFCGIVFFYLATIFRNGPQSDILYYFQFYALGDLIAKYILNKNLTKYYGSYVVFLCLLPFFILSQAYYLSNKSIEQHNVYLFAAVALIGCAFILNICFILQKWGKMKFLKVVGYHSLYIYVMHVMIISFFRSFFVRVFDITFVPLLLIINLTLGMVLSIIIYNLAVRAGLWFLFTLDKSRTKLPAIQFHIKRRQLQPLKEKQVTDNIQ